MLVRDASPIHGLDMSLRNSKVDRTKQLASAGFGRQGGLKTARTKLTMLENDTRHCEALLGLSRALARTLPKDAGDDKP